MFYVLESELQTCAIQS